MECPYCTYDNIPGVDQCECCRADLSDPVLIEEARTPLEREMLNTPLSSLSVKDYIEVAADLSVGETVRRLNDVKAHCAIVVEGDVIAGILTERDLLMKVAHQVQAVKDDAVRTYMTPNPETLRHDDPVVFGLNRMVLGDYRHIPLERDGKLVGVVSVRHVLDYVVRQLDRPAQVEART